MKIMRAIIDCPRTGVTLAWMQEKETLLATIGLRIVSGVYRKSRITLIAVRTAGAQ